MLQEYQYAHYLKIKKIIIKSMTQQSTVEERLLEQLASIEHDRWAHWQKYMHSKIMPSEHDGIWQIGEEHLNHWNRQIATPYSELTEAEKESDRNEVRKYLRILLSELQLAEQKAREEINNLKGTIADLEEELEKLEHLSTK